MEPTTDYTKKSITCIRKLRLIFIVTFSLMFVVIGVMLTLVNGFNGLPTVNFVDFVHISKSKLSPAVKSNSFHIFGTQTVNKMAENMTSEGLVYNTTIKEFPGMPDPCIKPRRSTGVEDILCMKRPTFLPEYKNPCWLDAGSLRCLPYFHLIGICKSGTSDFFKRILLHPKIVPNKGIFGKEIWYWSWKRFEVKNRGGRVKLGMTLREFTSQFHPEIIQNEKDKNGYHSKITGHGDPMDIWDRFKEESLPQNTPGAEELLWTTPYAVRHINPDVKLLLMLRDPIERLYSHYFHSGAGTSAQSFHDHIVYSLPIWNNCLKDHTIRSCIYNKNIRNQLKAPIYTSFYIIHLQEWLKAFPRDQIYIFRNEDYTKDMQATLTNIFTFLNVSIPEKPVMDQMKKLPHFYATKAKARAGPMKPETKQLLLDLYRPYTEQLAEFLRDDKFNFKDGSFG